MAESADSCGFRYIRQPNMGIDGFPVIVYNVAHFAKKEAVFMRLPGDGAWFVPQFIPQ